ncbi:MAG TPA: hypothetical protein DEO89_08360 [Lachnospiraceae bacterium]|nr:hypothetical protein [Lachnospiraceae bacterium]
MKKSLYLQMKVKLLMSAKECNSYAEKYRSVSNYQSYDTYNTYKLPNYQAYGACTAYKDVIEGLEHNVELASHINKDGYVIIDYIHIVDMKQEYEIGSVNPRKNPYLCRDNG